MEEFYRLIEEKIKKSGYPGEISGREFYADVCDEADEQDLGMFLCLIKKSETISYEVRIENLHGTTVPLLSTPNWSRRPWQVCVSPQ